MAKQGNPFAAARDLLDRRMAAQREADAQTRADYEVGRPPADPVAAVRTASSRQNTSELRTTSGRPPTSRRRTRRPCSRDSAGRAPRRGHGGRNVG